MTLYRQLILTVVALFSASFLASVTISTNNLRSFLVEQFATHAQDTATSLGLALSPYMKNNDAAVMNAMIDAIFDRGYFKSITLISVDGNHLIERVSSMRNPDVPSWFIDLVDLRLPVAEAMVLSGWKPAATISVSVHSGHAYQELWENFRNTLLLFSLTAGMAMLLGVAAVHLLLKPLKRVEEQAGAICRQDFVTQRMLPRTRELRRVVKAMNRLSGKINEIFAEQATLTERLRVEAYQDELTGLGNRRYFNRRLQTLLEPGEDASTGIVLLVELSHLAQINMKSGYQAGDELLRRVAQQLMKRLAGFERCFSARVSGAGFGVVIEDIDGPAVDTLAASLSDDLLQGGTSSPAETGNVATIGVALWKTGDSPSDILARADIALRSARTTGGNAWQRYMPAGEPEAHVPDIAQWRSYLAEIIRTANVALCAQSVHVLDRAGDDLFHREVFLRLPSDDGRFFVTAGAFMSRAEQSDLACGMDKVAVEKLIAHLAANPEDTDRYALNLTSTSLHDTTFVDWLCSRLAATHGTGRRLAFEFPELAVLKSIQTARSVFNRLSGLGCDCGIDHFGHGFNSFGYLRSFRIGYLKLDGSYSRDIHKEIDNQFLVRTLVDTAHSVGIRVIAAAVESEPELEAFRRLSVDGVQGYLLGRPESL